MEQDMKITKAELAAVAVKREQYPPEDMPEIAFAGRSNVREIFSFQHDGEPAQLRPGQRQSGQDENHKFL